MQEVRKYLFDRSFDVEPAKQGPAPSDEPPPGEEPTEEVEYVEPPPTFTEEELRQACDEAFAAGREEGQRDAMGQAERRMADSLDMIGARLVNALEGLDKAREEATANAIAVAMGIARKLLPDLARRDPLGEVVAVVEQAMEKVLEEPRVAIRVAAADLASLEPMIADLARAKGYEGRVLVLGDPDLPPGDCRIEWRDGGAERDMAALWAEVDAVIERNLGLSEGGETSVAPGADPDMVGKEDGAA